MSRERALTNPERGRVASDFIDAVFRYLDLDTIPGADKTWKYPYSEPTNRNPEVARNLRKKLGELRHRIPSMVHQTLLLRTLESS